jgi:hypothetical protein
MDELVGRCWLFVGRVGRIEKKIELKLENDESQSDNNQNRKPSERRIFSCRWA